MNFQKFEIVQDLSDGRTEVIKYADAGIYLKVIPKDKQKQIYSSDAMVFVASMRRKGLSGRPIEELTDTVHLRLLRDGNGKRAFWNAELLISVVKFYCSNNIGSPAEQIHVHFNGRLIPFDDSYAFIDTP